MLSVRVGAAVGSCGVEDGAGDDPDGRVDGRVGAAVGSCGVEDGAGDDPDGRVDGRVGAAVGSRGVEDGTGDVRDCLIDDCVGATVAELLDHPRTAVRIAALDAYLMHCAPHPRAGGLRAEAVSIAGATSLAKSRRRAETVVDLLGLGHGGTVLVIGVVNSLLAQLRSRGLRYVPCDRAGGRTEWGDPVSTEAGTAVEDCDAMLVTGMTLGNGTFDDLRSAAVRRGIPMVMFAQSGSAILPWFVGAGGVRAVSAEPYPFFALNGGPSTLFRYREEASCSR
ncbi:hypothetical protein IT779_28550 [Nocardia sp. NEAU-351]|uniref:Putative heavy-metal chelation domain-containing protein n=1 Tax=Nocardia bovistercoris TaxID=2785916 RepID=A0A931III0_9NOCA|nr:hypothetical protein [Nocardia bovistercoris]